MERLKAIEKDIKSRMEEYALAEERMEVRILSRSLFDKHKFSYRLDFYAQETSNALKFQ